jgi:hypothetical protein
MISLLARIALKSLRVTGLAVAVIASSIAILAPAAAQSAKPDLSAVLGFWKTAGGQVWMIEADGSQPAGTAPVAGATAPATPAGGAPANQATADLEQKTKELQKLRGDLRNYFRDMKTGETFKLTNQEMAAGKAPRSQSTVYMGVAPNDLDRIATLSAEIAALEGGAIPQPPPFRDVANRARVRLSVVLANGYVRRFTEGYSDGKNIQAHARIADIREIPEAVGSSQASRNDLATRVHPWQWLDLNIVSGSNGGATFGRQFLDIHFYGPRGRQGRKSRSRRAGCRQPCPRLFSPYRVGSGG